jgi:hypothetical protein
MLGEHPDLYGLPELSLFRVQRVEEILRPIARAGKPDGRPRTSGLLRTLAELHDGSQDEAAVTRAHAWLSERASWPVECVLDQVLAAVAPRRAVENSPEDSNREDYLERLHSSYPNARFVHLLRHPVATARSMSTAWADAGLWDVPRHLFPMMCLGTWLFHHARVKRDLESLPRDRWIRLRAEDVINDPQRTLPAFCEWLGISAAPAAIAAMTTPDRSPYARPGPPSAPAGNDPAFMTDPVRRPVAVPRTFALPKDWTVDPWLHVAVVEFAQRMGYVANPEP